MRLRAIGFVLLFATAASAGPTAPAATMTSTAQPVAVAHPSLLVRPQLRTGMTLKDVFAASNPMPSVPPPPSSSTAANGMTTTTSCAGGGTEQITWQVAGHVDGSTGTGSYVVATKLVGCVTAQNGGTRVDGTLTIAFQGTGTSTQVGGTTTATGNWKYTYDGALQVTSTSTASSAPVQMTFAGFSATLSAKITVVTAPTGVASGSVQESETLNGRVTTNGQTTTYVNQTAQFIASPT